MKGGLKIWSTVVDYFLILGAIIGVGFASGKEICVFFFDFGAMSIAGLISFGLLYIYLFFIIQYISYKLKIKSYNEFNSKIFGKFYNLTKFVLLINFLITCAGMLAGADYLFATFFNVKYRIPSLFLSVLAFSLLLGGINKIKTLANVIIPIMLTVIVINSLKNITPHNVHLDITLRNGGMAVYYGLLFGVNNFVAAMPMLFETKLKSKGKLTVIICISFVILLNILVFASNSFSTDMPMFELSANVSPWFYYIYFLTLIMALFSTLIICAYNANNIISRGKSNIFTILVTMLVNLILSNLGYQFIVQYLYVLSGIISGIYVITLVCIITYNLIRNKNKSKNIVYKKIKDIKICNKKIKNITNL